MAEIDARSDGGYQVAVRASCGWFSAVYRASDCAAEVLASVLLPLAGTGLRQAWTALSLRTVGKKGLVGYVLDACAAVVRFLESYAAPALYSLRQPALRALLEPSSRICAA